MLNIHYAKALCPRAYKKICNGVGPAFLQRLFPKLFDKFNHLPVNEEFHKASVHHDWRYWNGGSPLLTKFAADLEFFSRCMDSAVRHKALSWRRYVLAFGAIVYFVAIKSWASYLAWHWFGRRDAFVDLIKLEMRLKDEEMDSPCTCGCDLPE